MLRLILCVNKHTDFQNYIYKNGSSKLIRIFFSQGRFFLQKWVLFYAYMVILHVSKKCPFGKIGWAKINHAYILWIQKRTYYKGSSFFREMSIFFTYNIWHPKYFLFGFQTFMKYFDITEKLHFFRYENFIYLHIIFLMELGAKNVLSIVVMSMHKIKQQQRGKK